MDSGLECNDYTILQSYNAKIFRVDNINLPTQAGLDMYQVGFGLFGGVVTFAVTVLPASVLLGGVGAMIALILGILGGIISYIVGKVKSPGKNPFHMITVFTLGRTQQQEEYPNDLHWQVIVVRHPWTTITANALPTPDDAKYLPKPEGHERRLDAESALVWDALGREYPTITSYDDYLDESLAAEQGELEVVPEGERGSNTHGNFTA